jgi:cyanophycinase
MKCWLFYVLSIVPLLSIHTKGGTSCGSKRRVIVVILIICVHTIGAITTFRPTKCGMAAMPQPGQIKGFPHLWNLYYTSLHDFFVNFAAFLTGHHLNMMIPKGKLIAIGGAEDKGTDLETGEIHRNNLNFFELGILRRIVDETGGPDARIEVITTASTIPVEVGHSYISAFTKIGCINIGVMDIRSREDVMKEEYMERLKVCDAVMFSGGNQLRLSVTDGGTEFLAFMKKRYLEDRFLIAGTSAGAMAMGKTMIYEGNAARAHLKGEVKMTTGLGFIDSVIIDSHFEKRGRFGRLAQAVACNPSCTGIGLGEDTGMLITGGNRMEAIGSGLVVIIDGHDINHNNIADIPDGNPISIENLRVHFCENGNGYLLNERQFLMEASEGALVKKQVEVE